MAGWLPVVKPHSLPPDRWSGRYSPSLFEDLVSPHLDPLDTSCDMRPGPQITSHQGDLVYVSSDNTLTILHSACLKGEKCETAEFSDMEISFTLPGDTQTDVSSEQTIRDDMRGMSDDVIKHTPKSSREISETDTQTSSSIPDCSSTVTTPERSDLAREVSLLPTVSHIQVFETQLAVAGVHSNGHKHCIVHTMYHVFVFTKTCAHVYTQRTLYTSPDHVLSVVMAPDNIVHILTVSRVVTCQIKCQEGVTNDPNEITSQVDVSDLWRVNPAGRAVFGLYRDEWFVVVEPSAIHFLTESQHVTPCTVPTDFLEYTEKFLSFLCVEEEMIVVSTSYLLVFSISQQCELTLQRQLSHNVTDAYCAQFYPTCAGNETEGLMFSVISDSKCSFFNINDCPTSEYVTSIVPYKVTKLRSIELQVLDKSCYLSLSVDKRNCVTRRINSGFSGAFTDRSKYHFILNEHKDLFCSYDTIFKELDSDNTWNDWLSVMTFDREYWTESVCLDIFYKNLLGTGLKLTKSTNKKKCDVPRDPLLNQVEDKYTRSLVDTWEWG